MAVVMGDSGALKDLQRMLARSGLRICHPSELAALCESVEAEMAHARAMAERKYESVLAELVEALGEAVTRADAGFAEVTTWVEARSSAIRNQLASFAARRTHLFWPPLFVKWLALRRTLRELQQEGERELRRLVSNVEIAGRALRRHRDDREGFVSHLTSEARTRLEAARSALGSPEHSGAAGELEVIEALRRLPESYHVLCDLRLRADKAIRFDDEWLVTAQLDAVVVGRAGVFTIETKTWSAQFLELGRFFDPYKQVHRASYLCYRLLRDRGMQCKVRSILATKGKLPPKPTKSYTKVLRPEALCGYIEWFESEPAAKTLLTGEQVAAIAVYLGQQLGG